MKYILLLLLLTFNTSYADEVYFGFGSFVYHTDRTKNLNEDNDLLGLRYGHNVDEDTTVGVILQDFTNSINKQTTLLGAFIEQDIYKNERLSTGVGATIAGQVRKGYNIPVLGNAYVFAEYDRLRVNAMYIPPIKEGIDSVFIATFEVKLAEW